MKKLFLSALIIFLTSGVASANTSNIFENSDSMSIQLLKLQVQQNEMLKNYEPEEDLYEEETIPTTSVSRSRPMKIIDKVEPKHGPVEGALEATTTRSNIWHFIKGKPMDDGIMIGMISYHTSPNGREYNEVNNLISIQYKGWTIGTFKNSFYDQSIYAGVSRKVWERKFGKDYKINLQYKAGLLWGYKDRYPNICGISPIALPYIGLNYKKIGVDISVIPSNYPIFTGNIRLDFPELKSSKKAPDSEINQGEEDNKQN